MSNLSEEEKIITIKDIIQLINYNLFEIDTEENGTLKRKAFIDTSKLEIKILSEEFLNQKVSTIFMPAYNLKKDGFEKDEYKNLKENIIIVVEE